MSLLIGKVTQNIPDVFNQALWSHSESEETNYTASLSALGVRNNFAKHPLLAVLENRRSTFLTYPHAYMSVIDVDLLADAGYFYQGKLKNFFVQRHPMLFHPHFYLCSCDLFYVDYDVFGFQDFT